MRTSGQAFHISGNGDVAELSESALLWDELPSNGAGHPHHARLPSLILELFPFA